MDGDQDTRPTLIAQPTPADSSELAGSARQREDKLFSGFESLDWRDNELLGLDVLDVDEEDDEAGAERRRPGSNQLSDDMTAATKASTAATEAPESLEVDTCRICSGPAEPGMPLYHPCKCSGTIRHVHQDCLKSWLDTSHRTRCDLCNHTFTYKKLYSINMPSTLPARVVIGPMLVQLSKWVVVFLRLLLVGTVWLALLPALLHWCWRVGFWLSDYVAFRLSGKLYYFEIYGAQYLNTSEIAFNASSSMMPSTTYSTYSEITFPTSLLQAISTAFPTHEPLSSAISSLQAVLQKHQLTATGPSATPHPHSAMVASAFSQIASILQNSNNNSRRSLFRPRPGMPGSETPFLQRIALSVSGEAMFQQGSSFYWDLLRLSYHFIRRVCGRILSTCVSIVLYPYHLFHHLLHEASSAIPDSSLSTWQKIDKIAEELTAPIVAGQIIAVVIVVAFVLLFFLREWVMVNADPGMFDDARVVAQPVGRNENGVAAAPREGNADVVRNDVPGAFPPDANPPVAAPRPAEWDRDVDLAEPRPPSPNIISLAEQEELMKEIVAWRKEQEKVISKSKAKVDEWQWEKKRVIIDDWKEQKMKAIKDKVAVEDDGRDLLNRNVDSSVHMASSSDKGKGKEKLLFDDSDIPFDKFEFRDLDSAGNDDANVEHIENLPRPAREMPHHSRFQETPTDDPITTLQMQHPRALSAGSTGLLSISPARSSLGRGGAGPSLFEQNREAGGLLAKDAVDLPSLSFNSWTKGAEVGLPQALPTSKVSWQAAWASAEQAKPQIGVAAKHDLASKSAPVTKPAPSVFSGLVPPMPMPSSTAQLPFSIRDVKLVPLQQRVVAAPVAAGTSSTGASGHVGQFLVDGLENTDDKAVMATTSSMTRRSAMHYADRHVERVEMKRQRPRGRPDLLRQDAQGPVVTPLHIPPPLPGTTLPLPPQNWVMSPLPMDNSRNEDGQTSLMPRPFSVPPPSGSDHAATTQSAESVLPPSQAIPKPAPSASTILNINAKPFQPGTRSAPITPTDRNGFGMAQRGYTGVLQPSLTIEPLARAPVSHPSDLASFPFAPFDVAPTKFYSFGQTVPSQAFLQQSYSIPHSAPGLGSISTRPTFNTGRGPIHGHQMSMGMGSSQSAPTPVTPPVVTRGRAMTTGTDRVVPSLNDSTSRFTYSQAHQRSSSLSSHLTRSHLKADENNLLRPSGSGGDSSTTNVIIPPVPWYGLPDPRPDVDRKKLEELEKKEERKRQKAAAAAAKSNGVVTSTDIAKPTASRARAVETTAPVDLIIIESGKKKQEGIHLVKEQLVSSTSQENANPISERNSNPEKTPNADPMSQSGDLDRNIQPINEPQRESMVVQQPAGDEFKPSRAPICVTPPLGSAQVDSREEPSITDPDSVGSHLFALNNKKPEADHSGVSATAQVTHINRVQGPGSITTPKLEPISTGEQINNGSLKRPALPSAASPIVLKERSTSQIALYQAPEEIRPQAKKADSQIAAESDTKDHYFQPLRDAEYNLEASNVGSLNVRDRLERVEAMSDHEDGAPVPAMGDDLPDLVDFDIPPEEDANNEGMEVPANMANAEEVAAPPPAEDAWDDEWAHLLEAVGMTGPWYSIVQNAALVIVIFNVTLGIGVFMPYVLGKTTSLIMAEPSEKLVQLAAYSDRPSFFGKHFPPLWRPREDASFSLLGKGIAFLFGDLGPPLKYMMATGHRLARSYLATVARLISLVRKPAVTEKMETHASNLAYEVWSMVRPTSVISGFLKSIIHSVRLYQANMACNVDAPAASSIVNVFHVIDYAVCSIYPEFLLSSAPTEFLFEHWVFSSLHKIATHRISAIVFGYLITIAALALHARVSTQKNSLMVLTLFKVGSFVLFEAVIKPLLFGFLIDIFTLSLFSGASVQSRIAFWRLAPYSNLFHHWLIGNVVVVQFLYFLQDIQKSLRPGALLQIRQAFDPTTPTIRDMINKSLAWHVIRYTVTLTTNLCLLWVILGLTMDVNNLLTSNFAPMRWDLRRPFSDVPIDLIVLHIFLPATVRFLKLKRVVRNMGKTYFTELSRFLDLQSVLLGEALIDPVAGSYWRVPVTEDAIRLAGRPYAIQTDALGNGLTQEDKDMIDLQIFASRKGQRIPHNDYKVVFYPDWFRLRITIFLFALWAGFFGAVWTSFTLPIRMGRLVFKILFGTTTIHDMYSWIVGLYLFWFCSFVKYLVGREQRRWSKYLSTRTRSAFPLKLFLRHTVTMLGRLALAVLWLMVLLPSLIGLLFEAYIVLPVMYQVYPNQTPTLRLWDAWAAGIVIGAIIVRAARLRQPDQLPEVFERIRREGWFKIKARALTSELGPLTLALFTLVLAPFTLQYALPAWVTENYAAGSAGNAVLKVILPVLFFVLLTGALVTSIHGMLYMWVETIRDQKYLEKEIIRNIEDIAPNAS